MGERWESETVGCLNQLLQLHKLDSGGHYLHGDLFEIASAYLFHLVQNHPFLDGNKRVGAATALAFLVLNGVETNIPNPVLAQEVLSVAQGKMDKPAIAAFFREHACL
jgi:death-on-curing protein